MYMFIDCACDFYFNKLTTCIALKALYVRAQGKVN